MQTLKLQNKETQEIIEIPYLHAKDVVLPQGAYDCLEPEKLPDSEAARNSSLVKVKNVETEEIIEVPLDHARDVLLPQGHYVEADKTQIQDEPVYHAVPTSQEEMGMSEEVRLSRLEEQEKQKYIEKHNKIQGFALHWSRFKKNNGLG